MAAVPGPDRVPRLMVLLLSASGAGLLAGQRLLLEHAPTQVRAYGELLGSGGGR
jgi:hypothetical protein